jgi:hypothetical protein
MDFHLLFTPRIAELQELRRQFDVNRLGAPQIHPRPDRGRLFRRQVGARRLRAGLRLPPAR